jgi:hypothetical protein
MTVRIETSAGEKKPTVSVAGRLEGLGVGELARTCRSIEGELVLDLSGLRCKGVRDCEERHRSFDCFWNLSNTETRARSP